MFRSYKSILAVGAMIALASAAGATATQWADLQTTDLSAGGTRLAAVNQTLYAGNNGNKNIAKYPLGADGQITSTVPEIVYTASGNVKIGNGWQGHAYTKDGNSLYFAADGAAVSDADPTIIVKLNTADGSLDTSYSVNGVLENVGRRGAIAPLSNGSLLTFSLGHSTAPEYVPFYNIVSADGQTSSAPVFFDQNCTNGGSYVLDDGTTVAGTIRSATTKFGTGAGIGEDIVFVSKGGSILKMLASSPDWSTTPTVFMFFDKEKGALPWQVTTQLTYDAESNMLYFSLPGKLYSINASNPADYSLMTIGASQSAVAQTWINGKSYAYVGAGGIIQTNAYVEKDMGELKGYILGSTDGAWSIDDGATWYNDDDSLELYVGEYPVKFKDVEGFFTPASQTVTVSKGESATVTGDYIKISSLKVTLTGAEGAKWSIDGGTTWNESGATISNLKSGSPTIFFSNVEDLVTPDTAKVALAPGEDKELTYNYSDRPFSASYKWLKIGSYDLTDVTTNTYSITRMTADNDGNLYFNMNALRSVARVAAAASTAPDAATVISETTLGSSYGYLGMDFFRTAEGGVAFETNKQIFKFNNEGTAIAEWGTNEGGTTFTEGRQAIAALNDGSIIAIPAAGGTYALKLSEDGKTETKITGSGPTTWSNRDACGRGDGTVYVCNGYKRIDRIEINNDAIVKSVNGFVPAKGAASNGGVFFDDLYNNLYLTVGGESKVYVCNADTGAEEQVISIEGGEPSDAAVTSKGLFVCKTNRTVDYFQKGTYYIVDIPWDDPTTSAPKWSLDGGANWNESGTGFNCLVGNAYTLTFEAVEGYNKPADMVILADEDTNEKSITAEYWKPFVRATATEGGTITPAGDVETSVGESLTFTMAADEFYNYTALEVDGSPIVGFGETFTFENLVTSHTINAVFTRQLAGSLSVSLEPTDAETSAAWSIDGGATWNESDDVLSNIPAGKYVITFRSLSGYKAPSPMAVTLEEHAVVEKTAVYTTVGPYAKWVKTGNVVIPLENLPEPRTNYERINFDAAGNVYLGGYGSYNGGSMNTGGVVSFPFNYGAVPAAEDITVPIQTYKNVWPAEWVSANGTQGFMGVVPAADGGMYLHQDNGYCFTFKTNADGTTDTTFANNGILAVDPNRFQSAVGFEDGNYGLVPLFNTLKMHIYNTSGTLLGRVDYTGTTSIIRDAVASGNDTVFSLGSYTTIDKVVFDPETYAPILKTQFALPAGAGNMGGLFYNAKDNTLLHVANISTCKTIRVYGADSGQLLQEITGASYNDLAVVNTDKGEFLVACNYGDKTLGVYKRSLPFTFDMGNAPEGAMWSSDNGLTWNESGAGYAAENNDNTIIFSDVEGYFTPAPVVVPAAERSGVLADDSYIAKIGGITVNLEPAEAVENGGWMLVEGAPTPAALVSWNASGATESGIAFGQYTVTFKDIPGYNKPDDMLADLNTTEGLVLTGTYTQIGTLTVVIDGPEEAKWTVSGIDGLFENGQTIKLAAGTYTVSFTDVAGWEAAPDDEVTIAGKDDAKTVLGVYTANTGSVSVSLAPAEAVAAGAAWSVDAGATWKNSGETVSDLAPGEYTVIYKELGLARWASPAAATVTVESGRTATATGTYSRYAGVWELF